MGKIGEWFWRFLAIVMVFAVGWSLWIFYQISPSPLATRAAYEAAAKARATGAAQGAIAPAPPATAASPASNSAEPPVNIEKLKMSDTIAAPANEPADGK